MNPQTYGAAPGMMPGEQYNERAERERAYYRKKAVKRLVSKVCMGADIYILAISAVQILLVFCSQLVIFAIPGHDEAVFDMLAYCEGYISVLCVIYAFFMLLLFCTICAQRGSMFRGSTPLGAVFERRGSFGIMRFAVYVAVIILFQAIGNLSLQLTDVIANVFGYTAMDSPAMNADYTQNAGLLLYACLAGPVVEELVFRGLLLKGLEPCGRKPAIFITALMFSLMHGDIQQLFFTFLAGLLFGYVALEYSIYASAGLHIFNNTVLGMLLNPVCDIMGDELFFVLSIVMIIVCLVTTAVYIILRRRRICRWFRDNHTQPGAYTGLLNGWFIVFFINAAVNTLYSFAPLNQ